MIRMISGTFGLLVDGIVVAKTKASEPFEASEEQEARLVKLGMAEYVNAPVPAEDAPEELPELPEDVVGIPEYNVDMKADELREIAAMMGLEFPANTKKQSMVDAMDKFLEENMVEPDEDAPVFDAAEAVQ